MAMKIEFEADVKNAQEVTRWLRDIEKHMNNVTTTSEGFTKSMLDGIEAIQKASSSMNLKGGMKETFESFGAFKEVAKESADILRGYFADSAKKAEQAATASFSAIGREMKKVNDELKTLGESTDEYKDKMSELSQLKIQMETTSRVKDAASKERQKIEGTETIALGGKSHSLLTRMTTGRMEGSYGRFMDGMFGERGTKGFGGYAAAAGGGMAGIASAAGMYGSVAAASFLGGVGINRKVSDYMIQYGQKGVRGEASAQRMAMGGLEGANSGDYSEAFSEMYGRTGQVRKGNLSFWERSKMGTSWLLSGGKRADEELLEEQAQQHLQYEKQLYKYYSQGMRHRVRISNKFRGSGQTFGDVTDQYADTQETYGVGQAGMDQFYGAFQSMQMADSGVTSPGTVQFYQSMKKYGVSPAMMQQVTRQQRSGRSFSSGEAGSLLTNLMGAAGLQNPDQITRQYVTDQMAQAMGNQASDTYALGETGRVTGAVSDALGRFGGLNSLYVSQNAIGAMNKAFAPVNKDGSYENSLMREQLRSMGLDSSTIDLWFKSGGPSNASSMEDMANAFGMAPQEFSKTLWQPVRDFHEGQREIMTGATSGPQARGYLNQVRDRWVQGRLTAQSGFYKRKFQGTGTAFTTKEGNTYSNNEEGWSSAAKDRLSKQSIGITPYNLGKAGTVDEAVMRLDPEQIDLFKGSTISSGAKINRDISPGIKTEGESQEEIMARTMAALSKAVSGESDSIFKQMNSNLQKIIDALSNGASNAGKPDGHWGFEKSTESFGFSSVWIPDPPIEGANKASDNMSKGIQSDEYGLMEGTGIGTAPVAKSPYRSGGK